MSSSNDIKTCLDALTHWAQKLEAPMNIMEVCGTHTVSIARNALKEVLPQNLRLISGPGCPVCVTHQDDLERILLTARKSGIIIATYGDMLRVPGHSSTLMEEKARGSRVEVVTSVMDALDLAESNPTKKVIFLGVGFETTTPATAAGIIEAQKRGLDNFLVYSLHKTVPPILHYLAQQDDISLQGLLLPGHVAVILGSEPFAFLSAQYGLASAIGGFEPLEILLALASIVRQKIKAEPRNVNAYPQAVRETGNPKAREMYQKVFTPGSSLWRGLGKLEKSGLFLKEEFASFDASPYLAPLEKPAEENRAFYYCGNVLMGRISSKECPLFGNSCNPQHPLGPAMVSTEGSCAATYRYGKSLGKALSL